MSVTDDRILLIISTRSMQLKTSASNSSPAALTELGCIFLGENIFEVARIEIRVLDLDGALDQSFIQDLNECLH